MRAEQAEAERRVCTECMHTLFWHDSIGCNAEGPNLQPCYCETGINIQTGQPEPGVYAPKGRRR